ncbi:hypothetical protein JXJ21_16780 [candidate division KSB1 bacterium]|nr:hypothetical protein [candidate division KSB1 bacterium]
MLGLAATMRVMLILGPIVGLNELVLSVWLIAQGFNTSAIAPDPQF